MLSRTERLDRLPVTSKHKRLLLGSGLGWALDAMDVGLISFIMAALAVHWDLGLARPLGWPRQASLAWRSVQPLADCWQINPAAAMSFLLPCLSTVWQQGLPR